MASPLRTTSSIVLLLLFMLLSISSTFASPDGSLLRRDLLAFNPALRKQGGRGSEPMPNCNEMASRTECERNSKWCRWCRSDALDDMCFGTAEAWRLPVQERGPCIHGCWDYPHTTTTHTPRNVPSSKIRILTTCEEFY